MRIPVQVPTSIKLRDIPPAIPFVNDYIVSQRECKCVEESICYSIGNKKCYNIEQEGDALLFTIPNAFNSKLHTLFMCNITGQSF